MSIQTGKQLLAGTPDAGVYVVLVGTGGHTGRLYLHSALSKATQKKYIGRGTIDHVLIKSNGDHDLGEVMVVYLGIEKSSRRLSVLPDPWFVDSVSVFNYQTKKPPMVFPCYHWIGSGDSVSFTAHTSKSIITPRLKELSMQFFFKCKVCTFFKYKNAQLIYNVMSCNLRRGVLVSDTI